MRAGISYGFCEAARIGSSPENADLQGIWPDEFDTPLQRPAEYANQEFSEAQRQELDKQRAQLFGSDPRQERGTAVDVGGAYNTAFFACPCCNAQKRARTSSSECAGGNYDPTPSQRFADSLRSTTLVISSASAVAMARSL